jgi:hypothetical protein
MAQVWFEAGATKFEFADAVTLAIVQSFLMGFAESKRYNDFINPGSQGEPGSFAGFEAGLGGTGVNGYPGASFDPFGYSKDPKVLESMKLKEIKNGACVPRFYCSSRTPATPSRLRGEQSRSHTLQAGGDVQGNRSARLATVGWIASRMERSGCWRGMCTRAISRLSQGWARHHDAQID